MTHLSRRQALLHLGSLGAVTALASACTVTKVGRVTTVILSVTKINSYVQAGLNAASTVEALLVLLPSVAGYVAPLQAATALLKAAGNSFADQVGTAITVRYDDSSAKAWVDSILTAIQQLADIAAQIVSALLKAGLSLSETLVGKINLVHSALATIVAVFKAILTPSLAVAAMPQTLSSHPVTYLAMSEQHALRTLGV